MILTDLEINRLALEEGMITPFNPHQIRTVENRKIISKGTSSHGYDMSLAEDQFKLFAPIYAAEIDPKDFNPDSLISCPIHKSRDGSLYFMMPPHSYALGLSVETWSMPRNVLAIALGKSTYARCGLIVNCTPLEAGWKGRLVIELANTANLPLRVYAGEGIAQTLFFQSQGECRTSYADRGGKYQNQESLTTAKV